MKKEIPTFKFAVNDGLSNIFLPTRKDDKDTGWDVRCAEKDGVIFQPFEKKLINLGIRMFAPEGWWLELRPRSSSFYKKDMHCLYGVIDEGFERNLLLACQYIPKPFFIEEDDKMYTPSIIKAPPLKIEFEDRIGQVIPVKRQQMNVEFVSNDDYDASCIKRQGNRGTKGFGSSGVK
jgi:dUTPase